MRPLANTEVVRLLEEPILKRAFNLLDEMEDEIMQRQIEICQIPAPAFQESLRASYLKQYFSSIGLKNIKIDEKGNLLAEWSTNSLPSLCISAHLDTVFPEGTNCSVRKVGGLYLAPGICDDAAGLAGLSAIATVLTKLEIRTEIPILFAATVGEEALGNLRGVRHLFAENKDKIRYFISLDGAGIEQITNRALGSKRYKIEVEGPGGHSWGDFGMVNPIQALGRAIHKMLGYKPPKHPRTSYNIGIISGGKSVNSIPQKASFEIDLRSISQIALQELEQYMINAIEAGVLEENEHAQFRHSLLQLKINLIGERPSGEISQNSKIVKTAMDATFCLGATPMLECASTDANIPISIGVEAITLGAGGICGSCHTTQEWFNPESRSTSLKRTLLLILALAGMKKSY